MAGAVTLRGYRLRNGPLRDYQVHRRIKYRPSLRSAAATAPGANHHCLKMGSKVPVSMGQSSSEPGLSGPDLCSLRRRAIVMRVPNSMERIRVTIVAVVKPI